MKTGNVETESISFGIFAKEDFEKIRDLLKMVQGKFIMPINHLKGILFLSGTMILTLGMQVLWGIGWRTRVARVVNDDGMAGAFHRKRVQRVMRIVVGERTIRIFSSCWIAWVRRIFSETGIDKIVC